MSEYQRGDYMKKILIFGIIISFLYILTGCKNNQIEIGSNEQHIIISKDKKTVTKYYTLDIISSITELKNEEIEVKSDEELLELFNSTKYSKAITYNTLEKDSYGYKVNYDSYRVGYSCNDDIIEYAYETIGSETDCSRNHYKKNFDLNIYDMKFYNKDNEELFNYDDYVGKKIYRYKNDLPNSELIKTYITLPKKILMVGVHGEDSIEDIIYLVDKNTLAINEDMFYATILIIFE